ncbi:MAG: acyl-CoA dehydratase activase [Desulfobacterales bacterium]
MITAGIDIGTRTAKAVILGQNGILASVIRPVDDSVSRISRRILKSALKKAGVRRGKLRCAGATGYGRKNVRIADLQFTSPVCAAKAAYYLNKEIHTVIDIGGIITCVVQIGENGSVLDTIENEKCASGSGRFLEMIAEAMEIPLEEIGPISLQSVQPLNLSNQCVVFAESEIISHVNANEKPEDILAALHRSIAEKAFTLAKKVTFKPPTAVIGGVAKNTGVVHFLEQKLASKSWNLSEDPQIISALGAALLAREGNNRGWFFKTC